MGFVDKRLLLSTETCLNWVTIGAVTYMSVFNETSNYYRIYSATAGGPLVQINTRVATGFRPYVIFKKGTTLYAGYYQNNANSFMFYKYMGGTTWVFDGFLNGATTVLQIREYNGNPYLMFTGFFSNIGDGQTWLIQYGTGAVGSGFNNCTIVKQLGDGTPAGRAMRSFDIGPTGIFYIMDQTNAVGGGSAKVTSRNGVTESVLVTMAASSEAMSLCLYNGVIYLLRSGTTNHVFSKLDSLTAPAAETIINNTSISNGLSGIGGFRASRSAVIHDMLVFEWQKLPSVSTREYGFFSWDTTTLTLDVLATYAPGGTNDNTGQFVVEGDEIIFGVQGKYITMVHQAPDDPGPEPEPEPTIEQLADDILVEVRSAPCNPIMLAWLNSLGGWDTYAFEDMTGIFESEIRTTIDAEYERYVEQLDVDTTTTGITQKTVTRSLRLGADNIDKDIFVGLIELFTSPAVDMLVSADPLTWQRVRVSPGSIRYSETERVIELTLELPTYFIQRS